jgi:hypothetical protein
VTGASPILRCSFRYFRALMITVRGRLVIGQHKLPPVYCPKCDSIWIGRLREQRKDDAAAIRALCPIQTGKPQTHRCPSLQNCQQGLEPDGVAPLTTVQSFPASADARQLSGLLKLSNTKEEIVPAHQSCTLMWTCFFSKKQDGRQHFGQELRAKPHPIVYPSASA